MTSSDDVDRTRCTEQFAYICEEDFVALRDSADISESPLEDCSRLAGSSLALLEAAGSSAAHSPAEALIRHLLRSIPFMRVLLKALRDPAVSSDKPAGGLE